MKIRDLIKRPKKAEVMTDWQKLESPIAALHREINRIFDQFMSDFQPRFFKNLPTIDFPKVDLKEKGKEIVVEAELPGMEQDDIHVRVDDDMVTIFGEKKIEKEEEKGDYYLSERSYGSFHRVIPLPDEVEADKAEAKYRHGVLKIRLPKKPDSQRRSKIIKIE